MKSRILLSSLVLDLLDNGFDSQEITSKVRSETDSLLEGIRRQELNDWEIRFIFRLNNARQILIYTKGKSNTKERFKELTIHIPIPTIVVVPWGVSQEQHIYEEDHLDNIIQNFTSISVQYSDFSNRGEFIYDSMLKSIQLALKIGIKVNGVKVQINTST